MDRFIAFLISVRLSSGGAYIASCEQGWFGASCEFACHCKYGPCSPAGQCLESGDLCEEGWFGHMCQYKDAMHGAIVEAAMPDVSLLQDNNPNTCSELTSVRITLADRLTFTFLRLVLNNEEVNKTFSISFVLDNSQTAVCADVKNFSHDTNVDLACKMSSVTQIHIEWRQNLTVCSIYVSRGRNLALKQKVSVTSKERPGDSEAIAVDGVKASVGDVPVNCTATSTLDTKPSLAVVFGVPQSISTVVITSLKGHYEDMRRFQLSLYGEQLDPVAYTYLRHGEVILDNAVFTIHVNASALIRKIELSLYKRTPRDALYVCEIEAFGDCGYPNYGLLCEEICSFHCTDLVCHVTGECWKCDEGYQGVYCEKGTKEVVDKPVDDDHGPRPEQTVQGENISRLLTFIFVVFGATILMEIAGLVHLRKKQKAIVEEVRRSLVETASDKYVPYIYADTTSPKPSLVDDDRAYTSYSSPELEDVAVRGSTV